MIRRMTDDREDEVTVLAAGRFLRLVRRGRWEYVERVRGAGAAAVVAVTEAGAIVLISQPRPALGGLTIELPAGLVGDTAGDEGEAGALAAGRELVEETGYEAAEITPLMAGPSSPGLTNEGIALFRARGLRRVGPGGGVEHEQITVHEVPLAAVDGWLAARAAEGYHVDVKVYAGLYFAKIDA
jgi:ADP-ribose pyrophosphatase